MWASMDHSAGEEGTEASSPQAMEEDTVFDVSAVENSVEGQNVLHIEVLLGCAACSRFRLAQVVCARAQLDF
jgi:hypothetical protein